MIYFMSINTEPLRTETQKNKFDNNVFNMLRFLFRGCDLRAAIGDDAGAIIDFGRSARRSNSDDAGGCWPELGLDPDIIVIMSNAFSGPILAVMT